MRTTLHLTAVCLLGCTLPFGCSESEPESASPVVRVSTSAGLPESIDFELEALRRLTSTWGDEHREVSGALRSLNQHMIENWLTEDARARVEAEAAFLAEHEGLLDAVTDFVLSLEQPLVVTLPDYDEEDPDGALGAVVALAGNLHMGQVLANDAARAQAAKDHDRAARRCAALIAISTIRSAAPDPLFCHVQAALLRLGISTAREVCLSDLKALSPEQLELLLASIEPLSTEDPLGVISATENDPMLEPLPGRMRRESVAKAEKSARVFAAVVAGFRTELEGLAGAAGED